jgi:hypothetical protein
MESRNGREMRIHRKESLKLNLTFKDGNSLLKGCQSPLSVHWSVAFVGIVWLHLSFSSTSCYGNNAMKIMSQKLPFLFLSRQSDRAVFDDFCLSFRMRRLH